MENIRYMHMCTCMRAHAHTHTPVEDLGTGENILEPTNALASVWT